MTYYEIISILNFIFLKQYFSWNSTLAKIKNYCPEFLFFKRMKCFQRAAKKEWMYEKAINEINTKTLNSRKSFSLPTSVFFVRLFSLLFSFVCLSSLLFLFRVFAGSRSVLHQLRQLPVVLGHHLVELWQSENRKNIFFLKFIFTFWKFIICK